MKLQKPSQMPVFAETSYIRAEQAVCRRRLASGTRSWYCAAVFLEFFTQGTNGGAP
jgi:hypothetical protein